jgi:RNA polymerase sigma factor (TIGR02999 family)
MLAGKYLRFEHASDSLQPTALVNEAYLRLVDGTRVDWQGKTHFYAVSARAMRRVLVQRARARQAKKRGGERLRVTLQGLGAEHRSGVDFLALDEALARLAKLHERQSKVVELRFFAGLDVEKVSATLRVPKRTVERDWTMARAWLKRELREASAG